MSVKNAVKALIDNASATMLGAMGKPHNHPQAKVNKRLAQLDLDALALHRVQFIAQVTGRPVAVVQGFAQAYERETWEDFSYAGARRLKLYGLPQEDAHTLYTLVRAINPTICVETGTASGMSATVILSHLVQNPAARLYSIDVESPKSHNYGGLIPQEYQAHFEMRLQKDPQAPLLPALLEELGQVDFFYHDSVHTVQHMHWEFELAWPYVRPGGCLASHDVYMTTAFDDFMKAHAHEIAGGGEVGNFGFVIKLD